MMQELPPKTAHRADELLKEQAQRIISRTDRMFAGLLLFQWAASIGTALWISPKAWEGSLSYTHPHVWAALLFGGTVTLLPLLFIFLQPNRTITRHIVAVGQMLMSVLLIHLTGGRIETHFHVFGS